MNVNIEKTKEYYENYKPCSCEECRNFFECFWKKYSDIGKYL